MDWLNHLLPLARETFFLGFLNNRCATTILEKLYAGKEKASYVLFLSPEFVGKVCLRGMSSGARGGEPILYEFDPSKNIPEDVYRIMTTQIPMFRADNPLHKGASRNDFSMMHFHYCNICGRIGMSEKVFKEQCYYNSMRDYNIPNHPQAYTEWIPCTVCEKGRIITRVIPNTTTADKKRFF